MEYEQVERLIKAIKEENDELDGYRKWFYICAIAMMIMMTIAIAVGTLINC